MAQDENPFENQPLDYQRRRARPSPPPSAPPAAPRVDPFQGKATWEVGKPKVASPFKSVRVKTDAIDPTNLGLFGAFSVLFSFLMLFIAAILARWDLAALLYGFVGVVLAGLMPYFYLGIHLPRAKPPVAPVFAKILAGGLLGSLLATMFLLFYAHPNALPLALALVAAVASTWLGVILLLASFIRATPA